MSELFDLSNFDKYKEDNCREVKKAEGGLPISLWETYSSFANSNGGVIILGAGERQDGTWYTTGLKNADKLKKNFWNTIHDTKKVSINLLSEKDVVSYEANGDTILVIYVPRAKRDQKPVYINNDIFGGSYRRDGEGDYHCTKAEVKAMLRDQTDDTSDMRILKNHSIEDFDCDSIHEYRRRYDLRHENGAWTKLTDEEFLIRIGAAKKIDENVYPTAAGLLMFGQEYMITNEFPEYFLDFREKLNPDIRWTDRVQSQSGDWSGNVFDFFCTIYRKITADFKRPFVTKDSIRQEEGPRHLGVREAIANCLVNTDYFQSWSVVIEKHPDRIEIANPGLIRVGKKQMMHGGISEPRNKVLLKMFNQIGVGEHAGSGVPEIFDIWKNEGLKSPKIREQFGPDKPDRTILILPLESIGKASNEANHDANEANYDAICKQILELLRNDSKITQIALAERIGVSRATVQRTMKVMSAAGIIKRIGATRGHWEIKDNLD